mmetsp:Transcript_44497/g.83359  ORF Transcript_44497/g.83359 Transcript_44497/m.83359 type:complete len:355 (+) Transcript_44497:20-1084(+)
MASDAVAKMAVAQLPRFMNETNLAVQALTLAQRHLMKAAEHVLLDIQEREAAFEVRCRAAEAELEERRRQLDMEAEFLQQQRDIAEEYAERAASRVRLNVGGKIFETSKPTLLAELDSMLYALMHSGAFRPDPKTGEYFIDRDPLFFGNFLNYMRDNRRDGELNVDFDRMTPTERRQLHSDIRYYQMGSLMHLLPPEPSAPKLLFRGFAYWNQDGGVQSHRLQDALMRQTAENNFPGSRPATLEEYMAGVIQDLPPRNNSGEPITFHGESSDGTHENFRSKVGISVGDILNGSKPSTHLYRHRRCILCVVSDEQPRTAGFSIQSLPSETRTEGLTRAASRESSSSSSRSGRSMR